MNLIANTGIQLFTTSLEVNPNDNFKMYFHEWYDLEDEQLKLEIAHFFSNEEIWVRKLNLADLGYAMNGKVQDEWETMKEDFEAEGYRTIPIDTDRPEESGCFQASIGRIGWEKFENTWFPMPFFLFQNGKSEFGPTNWCRFKLIPVQHAGASRKYNLVLAFDTRSVFEKEDFEDEDLNECPVFTNAYEKVKEYGLCNTEYKLVSYCSEEFHCEWVDKYVLKQFHNLDDIQDYKGPRPRLDYLAQYIFILRYLQQADVLPRVTLFSNQNVAHGNVDLVVDIGNSRTCAVLFDNSDITKTTPLALQDFTTLVSENRLHKHRDSFDMRLAFREADFGGRLGISNSRQFIYPSMIRLGVEAGQLIHKSVNMNTGAERTSTFSSPKRFLWDTKPQKHEWEFVQLEGETAKPIYIEGISEQLNVDGTINTSGEGGTLTQYSRKALMTFAFLEILAQAKMQINSYEQREYWGDQSTPRQIGRIIVTCPTAMSRTEQIALRKCAEDAAIILDRFFSDTYHEEMDEKDARRKVRVIPSAKGLAGTEERAEWIYDEATAAQFVFLYAEIRERYQRNVVEYFDFYGKVRDDLGSYDKKSLTIGSVDIGAGTTDVMIAAYKYDDSGQCTLTPVPLFWESFYKAGDDLMKELIHHLVVEGQFSPIHRKLRELGKNPVDLMQPFVGTDNGVSFRDRQLRSNFNLQVSVPIVSHFLRLLNEGNVQARVCSFADIFGSNPVSPSVLNHFRQHFGFDFESLQWAYNEKIVAAIVEKTFDVLVGKISSLLSHYACDIVLLSGRPTSLEPLTDLFLKYYAIAPNRLKTMNDYRVGRWYPEDKKYKFIDATGKFVNPKSIITTGAMIGHIAENGGLNGFNLNLKELKEKLLPTTHYFGHLNDRLEFVKTIISPDTNRATIEVATLPVRIGARQLDVDAYPSRPFYTFDFNDFRIEDRVKGRLKDENDLNSLQAGVDIEKGNIRRKMPLRLTIERELNEDIELLSIEEIADVDGNQLSKNFFVLQVQSMSELENFWLDSGIFSLNINHSNV